MKKAIAIILSIILVMAITLPAAAISTINVQSIKLDKSSVQLKVGQTYNLKVIFTPANTTQKMLTYATANKNIATVNATGKITGVSAGTTTITVLTFNKKILTKCDVTILRPVPKKAITLKIMSWHGKESQDLFYNGYKEIADAYTKANPNVKIEFVYQPLEGYTQLLDTQFIANSAPDIINMQRGMNIAYSNKSVLYNLNNVLNTNTKYNKNAKWIDTFVGGSESFTVARSSNIFGGIFFIPNDENPTIAVGQPYIYNKKIFKAAGLDPEKTPKTWAEFMDICKKLKDSGTIAISADNDRWIGWSFGDIANQFGEKYLDKYFDSKYNNDPLGALFTDKARITLADGRLANLDYYDDIIKIWKNYAQYWQKGWTGTSYDESRNLFVMQKAAMLKIGSWDHTFFKESIGTKFGWGVFPVPAIDEKTSKLAMGKYKAPSGQQNYGFAVNRCIEYNKYREETVIDFLKFFSSLDVQNKYVETAISYSPIKDSNIPAELSGYVNPVQKSTAKQVVGGVFVEWGDGSITKGLAQDLLADRIDAATYKKKVADNSKKASIDYCNNLLKADGFAKQITDAEIKLDKMKSKKADQLAITAQETTINNLKLREEMMKLYFKP